jgi:4-amino-4-deoxy-L-arabinose transferase-like glycosyltransferase
MRRIKFYLFLLWFMALFFLWAKRYPVPLHSGLSVLKSLACLGLLLGAMLALGRGLLRRLNVFFGSLIEEACFSLGLGALALSSAFFVLGHFAAAFSWVAWIVLGACWLAGFEHVEHFFSEFRHSLRAKHPLEGSSTELLTLLAAAFSLLAVLGLCLAPVTFYDALVYHLATPLRTAALGVSRPQPGNLFSWLPGGMEPLWTLCQLLDGGEGSTRLAQLFNFSLFAATALSVMDAGARFLPVTRLWLPAALFLTQPLAALAFGSFSPDGAAGFFTFLSLYAFLNALRERNQLRSGGWLKLAALLAGFAVAVKPVALIHAVLLLLGLSARAVRDADERRPGLLLACLGLFVLPLAPWLLRNFLLTSNPVYPFAFDWLGLKSASSVYFEHLESFNSGLASAWRLPWDVTFESASFGGNGHLSFLFLALLPAAFFISFSRELRWLCAYLVASFLLWAFGPQVLRYALPILPGLCLFAAYGLSEIEVWAASRSWGLALRLLVIATLFLSASQVFLLTLKFFDPFSAALGLERPEDYLARQGVSSARAALWLKSRGGFNQGLVLLGDSRTAYLGPRTLASTVFEPHPFKSWLAQSASGQDLDARLAQKGYDFVMINKREWDRVGQGAGPHYDYFSSSKKEALFMNWLQSHAADKGRVYNSDGVLLFSTRSSPKP